MRLPEHGVERLVELPGGGGLGAEPALLVDHVALRIELAEDRPQQALRLHPEPQLQPVLRHGDEVHRLVVGGERVHPAGARLGVDAVELVLDHERPLLFQERIELAPQRDQLIGQVRLAEGVVDEAQPARLPAVPVDGPDLLLDGLLLLDDGLIPLGVGGPDGRGSLEHHVFEEVTHPGNSRAFVGRSHVGRPAGGHRGHFGADDGEKAHPVREGELLHGDFGLPEQGGGDREREDERREPEGRMFHGEDGSGGRGAPGLMGLPTVTISG